jgi:hypothetical protein
LHGEASGITRTDGKIVGISALACGTSFMSTQGSPEVNGF